DGRSPGPELTSGDVEAVVSEVASHPEVRAELREAQRVLGRGGGVTEGRDIGTVVFPDADVKIFLSASPQVRAKRREDERGDGAAAGGAVAARDALDATTNPLEPAADAFVIDSSTLSPAEVLAEARRIVEGSTGHLQA